MASEVEQAKRDPISGEFEAIARRQCAQFIQAVQEAFMPSEGIEAMILVAFARGAAWALDINVDEASRRWTP